MDPAVRFSLQCPRSSCSVRQRVAVMQLRDQLARCFAWVNGGTSYVDVCARRPVQLLTDRSQRSASRWMGCGNRGDDGCRLEGGRSLETVQAESAPGWMCEKALASFLHRPQPHPGRGRRPMTQKNCARYRWCSPGRASSLIGSAADPSGEETWRRSW